MVANYVQKIDSLLNVCWNGYRDICIIDYKREHFINVRWEVSCVLITLQTEIKIKVWSLTWWGEKWNKSITDAFVFCRVNLKPRIVNFKFQITRDRKKALSHHRKEARTGWNCLSFVLKNELISINFTSNCRNIWERGHQDSMSWPQEQNQITS